MGKHPALDLRFAPGPGAGALQDFLYAELDAFEPIAIQEHESGDGWRVFFRTAADRNAAHRALASEFRNALLELAPRSVDDEDWARRSQANLKAVRVGRIVIAPPWDLPDPPSPPTPELPGPVVIVIEPSMGFGTGHHQSTRLCLALLQSRDVSGRTVVDAGTGSGVLAIAAAKLGAASVRAIDSDPDAIENARENIERNGVAATVEAHVADLAAEPPDPADLVLANLTGTLLARHASQLARIVRAAGVLIAAGLTSDEERAVVEAFAPALMLGESAAEDDWRGLVFIRAAGGDRPQPA